MVEVKKNNRAKRKAKIKAQKLARRVNRGNSNVKR